MRVVICLDVLLHFPCGYAFLIHLHFKEKDKWVQNVMLSILKNIFICPLFVFKVHIFWEGHKFWNKIPLLRRFARYQLKNLIHVESQACYLSLSYMSSVQFAAKKMNAHSAPWKQCGKVDKVLVPLFETKITTILLQSRYALSYYRSKMILDSPNCFDWVQIVLVGYYKSFWSGSN